jgi:RNA polymerase sigma-70 factor, ECF subfamily
MNLLVKEYELWLQMRAGDEAAFLELYRKRQGAIFRFALNMTGSTAVAEDVTQDVFLALIREKCGYDPERGTVSGYLFGIARKLILRHLERNRTVIEQEFDADESSLPEAAIVADPAVELVRREGIEELQRAVLALPKRYREVVVLCDLEELDYTQAAAALCCPVGTVRSRLHRARALLFEKLSQKRNPREHASGLKPIRSLI